MSDTLLIKTFNSRITSVMDTLLRAAAFEISRIFESSVSDYQLEIARTRSEVDALKRRLEASEKHVRDFSERSLDPSCSLQVSKSDPETTEHGTACGFKGDRAILSDESLSETEGSMQDCKGSKQSHRGKDQWTETDPARFTQAGAEVVPVLIKEELLEQDTEAQMVESRHPEKSGPLVQTFRTPPSSGTKTVHAISLNWHTSMTNVPVATPKKRRTDLTLAEKVQVIHMLEGEHKLSQTEVAKRFGCSQSQVCRASKNRASILQKWECNTNPKRKRMREGKDGQVEEALLRWFVTANAKSVPLSGPVLMAKAKILAEKLGNTDFKPTDGWFSRWKERNNISFKMAYGEKRNVDVTSMDNWLSSVLPTLLQEYDPEDIYSCDEMALLYRALPNGSLMFKTKMLHGSRKTMVRISVLLMCNMTGKDKRTPLVIGHNKNPRCFWGRRVPLPWYNNKNAWMTAPIFTEWIHNIDCEFGRQGRKVVLLLDSCAAHPHDIPLLNVRLVFLPSIVQPFEHGIISNFKAIYRAHMVKRILAALDDEEMISPIDLAEKTTVLDALYMVREAWKNISPETIASCFCRAGFATLAQPAATQTAVVSVNAPVGMSAEEFDQFIRMDDGLECTGDPTDEEICDEVRAARSSETDDSEDEAEPPPPPPSAAQVERCFNVIRDWMHTHDIGQEEYSSFCAVEGRLLDFILAQRKEKIIKDFFKPDSKC